MVGTTGSLGLDITRDYGSRSRIEEPVFYSRAEVRYEELENMRRYDIDRML